MSQEVAAQHQAASSQLPSVVLIREGPQPIAAAQPAHSSLPMKSELFWPGLLQQVLTQRGHTGHATPPATLRLGLRGVIRRLAIGIDADDCGSLFNEKPCLPHAAKQGGELGRNWLAEVQSWSSVVEAPGFSIPSASGCASSTRTAASFHQSDLSTPTELTQTCH